MHFNLFYITLLYAVCSCNYETLELSQSFNFVMSFFLCCIHFSTTLSCALKVLAESDQLRKEADDLGPRAELDHWKKRMSRFNYLLDQLKSPEVKAVLGVLIVAKSKLIKVI